MPAAPPRRPAEAALFDGARLALDGHTALEERVAEFEGIVLRGELPSDVTLPEDDAGAAAAVAEQYALYAARLFRAVAPPDDALRATDDFDISWWYQSKVLLDGSL